jgi:hypothetical protein
MEQRQRQQDRGSLGSRRIRDDLDTIQVLLVSGSSGYTARQFDINGIFKRIQEKDNSTPHPT